MKEKIQFEIDCIEFEINETQATLTKEVEAFKYWISKCSDAYSIASIPNDSRFQAIQSDVMRLRNLDDKKRWLLHLINDG